MRALRTAVAVVVVALAVAAAPTPRKGASSPVRISGVYFDGYLAGEPEPDSAIRLASLDPTKATSLAGLTLRESLPKRDALQAGLFDDEKVDEFDESAEDATDEDAHDGTKPKRKTRRSAGQVRLPDGAMLPAGKDIWIAANARGFERVFGFKPDYEAQESDPDVPNTVGGRFPLLPAKKGILALIDNVGDVLDFVAYDVNKDPEVKEADLPADAWTGPPVRLHKTTPYGWTGQVLARDRDGAGHLVGDTDSAADWDSGFSKKAGLGVEPVHRVELAGQSRFVARPHKGVRAKVKATSAPDNNYAALIEALKSARKSLRINIYQLTNPRVADEIVRARLRGVDVTLWLEGAPVGGIPDDERALVDRAHRAGVKVYFLATEEKARMKPRYRFDHGKYVIVDDKLAIIGTENYGHTGVPVNPTYGNRGWMVFIENKEIVAELRQVFDHDCKPGKPDVLPIDASPTDPYGLPFRDPNHKLDDKVQRGLYAQPAAPVTSEGAMDLELVLSPDTSLDEDHAILGMIGRAKKTLYVEQNSVRRAWGMAGDDPAETPNLALQAVVAAARRGVAVRVLLDSTWYNVQGDEDSDNDDTVLYLNQLAHDEGLDIVAKVVNLETAHLEKIHAKGVIVDGREVFVGSINWSENSFKGNREVGVVIGDAKIAGYYQSLFLRDWSQSRTYTAVVDKSGAVTASADGGKVLKKVMKGDRLFAVGEVGHGPKQRVEVSLGLGQTGFIDPNLLGTPEASAGEALHLIGRYAVVVGRVAATNVSDRRIQLRFADEARPPFTAVIFARNQAAFTAKGLAPASAFQGRELRVKGRIDQYKGPEIVLSEPAQVEIVR